MSGIFDDLQNLNIDKQNSEVLKAGFNASDILALPKKAAKHIYDDVDEVATTIVHKDHEIQKKADGFFDEAAQGTHWYNKVFREVTVTAKGALDTAPGLLQGLKDNFENPMGLLAKVGTAATMGAVIRFALPEAGAARALIGSVMGLSFLKDAASPLFQAWGTAWNAKDMQAVDASAKKMGDGLGNFAIDSAIGVGSGMAAEGVTGKMLKTDIGIKGVNLLFKPTKLFGRTVEFNDHFEFETAKQSFWNSDKYWLGRTLNRVASAADKFTGALAEKLITREPQSELSLEEQLRRVNEAGKHIESNVNDGGFYKYGPTNAETGARLNFSDYIDGLIAGEKFEKTPDVKHTFRWVDFKKNDTPFPPKNPEAELPIQELVHREKPKVPKSETVDLKPVVGSLAQETDFSNLTKLSDVARDEMEQWVDPKLEKNGMSKAQLYDMKDSLKSAPRSVSDSTRKGAILPEAYNKSAQQIESLTDRIESFPELQQAGFLLNYHNLAAEQIQNGNILAQDLNMFAREMYSDFRGGLDKNNISNNVLSNMVPSLVTIADDQGSGNFTLPHVDGILDRPVTIVPRNQTKLISGFAGINRHEIMGHDHAFGDLARFPKQYREILIVDAIKAAMDDPKNPIADAEIDVPGIGKMKKSDVFKQLLVAEANENTADFFGTATGGPDTALSLGILLQSLRKGGQLESRSVMGSQFPDVFEAHGIDEWRVKWCAEIMRQLGKGDKLVENYANALDNYAAQSARPGSNYVWASADEDNAGKFMSIPKKEWDAVIPHMVKAQLDTKLEALEGHSIREILPDMVSRVKNIDKLGSMVADSVVKGSDKLLAPFDKRDFTIGEVFSAGLIGWMRACAKGVDGQKALVLIDSISEGLRSKYRISNPHEIPLQASPIQIAFQQPQQAVSNFAGSVVAKQKPLREGLARNAGRISSATAFLLTDDLLHKIAKEEFAQTN